MQRAFHPSSVAFPSSFPGRMWVLSMFCNVSDSPRAHSSVAADQSFLLSHQVKTQLFWLFLEKFFEYFIY